MQPHSTIFPRRAGVLLHVTSLPSRHGVGDLGPAAHACVEWLEAAGLSWWQTLPVGPVGASDSPYSCTSATAGEPLLLSLEHLVRDGWLPSTALPAEPELASGPARYAAARRFKLPRLTEAHGRWRAAGGGRRKAFRAFLADQQAWLEPYLGHEAAVAGSEPEEDGLDAFLQYQFEVQWHELRTHARRHGVRLMGDVPLFVDPDAADVHVHPELFELDRRGHPKALTGCPPDPFNPAGQMWGHPQLDWDAAAAEGFRWWRTRVARQLELYDALRLDHFIGFVRVWRVPGKTRDARQGRWVPTRGRELLAALAADPACTTEFGLPLVAEDLGSLSPAVHRLRDDFDLPTMRLLQFGFQGDPAHLPHAIPEHAVLYTGTHDNDTTVGWWRSLDREARGRVHALTGATGPEDVAPALVRTACATAASTVVLPAQDLLGLPRSARMNRPGTTTRNWRWRLEPGALDRGLARRTHALVEASGRLAPPLGRRPRRR